MAELSLPSSLDYKKLPQLPDGVNTTLMSVQSTNGISFSPSQVIQFDLPSRPGLFIDGKSAFIRYKVTYTSGATAGVIRRKPVYTNFARLDEFVGSIPVNSVYQYNQVANMWVDANCNCADVYGQQYSWGLTQTAALSDLDGVTLPTVSADNTFYVSAPLVCSFLTGADKLLPTGLMAPIRIQLTVDTITNIATVAANITTVVISQPELCFNAIDMGVGVENMVKSMGEKIYIKTQGWANASQGIASSTSGFNTLSFNHRYESIENLYFLSSSSAAKAVNSWGDSFNPLGTAGVNGSFQVQIGQSVYPQLPLNNATGGIASIQQYLRECSGVITDQRNTMSIFNVNWNQYAGDATASTADAPAKFIIGIPLSRVNNTSPYQQSSLMSGVSAASMPINVLLNAGTAFNSAMNLFLIAQYTALLELDLTNGQTRVIC
jgi:hypothetical protein